MVVVEVAGVQGFVAMGSSGISTVFETTGIHLHARVVVDGRSAFLVFATVVLVVEACVGGAGRGRKFVIVLTLLSSFVFDQKTTVVKVLIKVETARIQEVVEWLREAFKVVWACRKRGKIAIFNWSESTIEIVHFTFFKNLF